MNSKFLGGERLLDNFEIKGLENWERDGTIMFIYRRIFYSIYDYSISGAETTT